LTFRALNGFYVSFSKPRFGYCFAMFGCRGNANEIARGLLLGWVLPGKLET
jgi:hypothetical protein